MTTVTEALMAMLGRCDGAITRDGMGFNGRDAPFAHDLGNAVEQYGSLTTNQERAIHKTMKLYKKQLSTLNIVYEELVVECEKKIKDETEIWTEDTQYGEKVCIKFPYDKSIISKIKDLDWDTSHREWTGSYWRFDINLPTLRKLKEMGFAKVDLLDGIMDMTSEEPEEEFDNPTIILGSNFSKIKGKLPKSVNDTINDKLAYQPPGFEWSPKYQDGEWDGWIRLYKHWDKTFPTGLLEMVKEVLISNGIEFDTVDEREEGDTIKLNWNDDLGDGKKLVLRDYQIEVIKDSTLRGSGFIVMPTGAGKTITALRMIYESKRKTVIFVHRKELLYQWVDRIESILGVKAGIVGDGQFEEQDITVAMLQTLLKKDLKKDYDMMFCDEGHHIPAEKFQEVAGKVKAKYRYSLSATMRREDGLEMLLWTQTGTMVANITVADLVEQGYLAKPIFVSLEHGDYFSGADYQGEVRDMVDSDKRNQTIVDYVKKTYKAGHKIYVDVKRIKHGKKLTEMLNDLGVNAIFISGSSSTEIRKKTLSTFEADGFVLVSTLIKEGVDLPAMSLVLLAGGGKSGIQVIQTVGRALRPKPGMNEAYIVDLVDNGKYSTRHRDQRESVKKNYYGELYSPVIVGVKV